MSVNRRTHSSRPSPTGKSGRGAGSGSRTPPRRSQSERRQQTRQALLDAALDQLADGIRFDQLSLRRVARAAGVVPAAFYRHFDSMDELALVLVEESVRTLRSMLREAREGGTPPERMIASSVEILVSHVREHRRHFAFIADARSSSNTVLRHTIRNEIRLFASELATDLARFPVLREWSTADLQLLAGLFVDTMIVAIDALLESPASALAVEGPPGQASSEIAAQTEKRMRLIALGVPNWRSRP
ncbi:MAG TPA: TetR family transcriptional regulator [Solirubrobacteraceae bacterium]|jgi:AcrR family transcriptional regulator